LLIRKHCLHGTANLVLCYQGETLSLEDTQMSVGVVTRMRLGQPQDMSSP